MKAKAGRAQLRELEGHCKDASFYSDQWAPAKLGLGKAHLVLCVCVWGGGGNFNLCSFTLGS